MTKRTNEPAYRGRKREDRTYAERGIREVIAHNPVSETYRALRDYLYANLGIDRRKKD